MIDAQPEEVGMSSRALENIERIVERYIEAGKYPGAITMVARHDQVVHFQTYGNMDDEAGKAMRPDAIVRAYSMTKPIASVALMQLYEQALFQLDDPVSAYQLLYGLVVQDTQIRVLLAGCGHAVGQEIRGLDARQLRGRWDGRRGRSALLHRLACSPVSTTSRTARNR